MIRIIDFIDTHSLPIFVLSLKGMDFEFFHNIDNIAVISYFEFEEVIVDKDQVFNRVIDKGKYSNELYQRGCVF